MRVIICGGRDYHLSEEAYDWLSWFHDSIHLEEVITGGASGIDTDAAEWASQNSIPSTVMKAAWSLYGKSAGYRRNRQMLDYLISKGEGSIAVIAFPGGSGTRNMVDLAKMYSVRVIDLQNKDMQ